MPKTIGRALMLAAAAVLLQGCESLQMVRVSPLGHQNSNSNRSMLSQFNPLPFQHRSVDDGALLRDPQDRGGGGLWYKRY
jgi:hypothetical protein